METGYKKQIPACYLLYRSAYLLPAYGQCFHFCHARNEEHPDRIDDYSGCVNGGIYRTAPSLIETYGSDIQKVYKANGAPLYFGLITMGISAFVHLMILCVIILLLSPILFQGALPANLPLFFLKIAVYVIVSLSIGSVLGLAVKNQARLTMIAQLIFLPSIMLSGIMFPIQLLPKTFQIIGKFFPAFWGYQLIAHEDLQVEPLWYLLLVFAVAAIVCGILLKKQKAT